jgi:hypothetical protein
MAGVDGLLPALVGRIDRLIAELSLARGLRIVTDIPPPLPTGPIVFFLLAALGRRCVDSARIYFATGSVARS